MRELTEQELEQVSGGARNPHLCGGQRGLLAYLESFPAGTTFSLQDHVWNVFDGTGVASVKKFGAWEVDVFAR